MKPEYMAVDSFIRFSDDTYTVEFEKRPGSDVFRVYVRKFTGRESELLLDFTYDHTVDERAGSVLNGLCDFIPERCQAFIPVALADAGITPPQPYNPDDVIRTWATPHLIKAYKQKNEMYQEEAAVYWSISEYHHPEREEAGRMVERYKRELEHLYNELTYRGVSPERWNESEV